MTQPSIFARHRFLAFATLMACGGAPTSKDGITDTDATNDTDLASGGGQGDCPVSGYPTASPTCDHFLNNPIDGLQAALNRTTSCNNPPRSGQPASACWDDGPTGTERYLGFCVGFDGVGVCVPGHLGPDQTGQYLVWDAAITCIDGEAAITTDGAKTCVPLCPDQTDAGVGASCAGDRSCVKSKTDGGQKVVCAG